MASVVFRVDAATAIGSGHVMRCLTLAAELRSRGHEVHFFCRPCTGNYIDYIRTQDFNAHALRSANDPAAIAFAPRRSDYESWLGVEAARDADECSQLLAALKITPEWIVADHYGIDARWQSAMRTSGARILAIDDLADRKHDCDILLDQNLAPNWQSRYDRLTSDGTTKLLGPAYALLNRRYKKYGRQMPARQGTIRRMLIYFGASDPFQCSTIALRAGLAAAPADVLFDVVISKSSPQWAALAEIAGQNDNVRLLAPQVDLVALMAAADLAIGAAGTTSWERLCMGLPAIVITIAENQQAIAEYLHTAGLIHWLGPADQVSEAALTKTLRPLMAAGLPEQWSSNCRRVVDGRGAERVAESMIGSANVEAIARLAIPEDLATIEHSMDDVELARLAGASGHELASRVDEWFRSKLRQIDGSVLFVVESAGSLPVGHASFEKGNLGWHFLFGATPIWRNAVQLGAIVRAAMKAAAAEGVFGLVQVQNVVKNSEAEKALQENGFKEAGRLAGGDAYETYIA